MELELNRVEMEFNLNCLNGLVYGTGLYIDDMVITQRCVGENYAITVIMNHRVSQ